MSFWKGVDPESLPKPTGATTKVDGMDAMPDSPRNNIEEPKLAEKIGSGGNKTVYASADDPNIVIAVLNEGKLVSSITKELGYLTELSDQGLSTVEIIGEVTAQGRPAVIMKRYAQGSKDIDKLDSKKKKVAGVGSSKLLNDKSISDLSEIKRIMIENKVKVDDLQFLIGKGGSIVIADPLDVHRGEIPAKNNLKMINLLIDEAKKNI